MLIKNPDPFDPLVTHTHVDHNNVSLHQLPATHHPQLTTHLSLNLHILNKNYNHRYKKLNLRLQNRLLFGKNINYRNTRKRIGAMAG
jgi:hypothetical protein